MLLTAVNCTTLNCSLMFCTAIHCTAMPFTTVNCSELYFTNSFLRIIGLDISDRDIEEMDINEYKDIVKKMVRKQSLHELKSIQKGHKKVKHIPFRQLVTPQEYLTSNKLANKMKIL